MTAPFDDPSVREDDFSNSDRGQMSVTGVREIERELRLELEDRGLEQWPAGWWMRER